MKWKLLHGREGQDQTTHLVKCICSTSYYSLPCSRSDMECMTRPAWQKSCSDMFFFLICRALINTRILQLRLSTASGTLQLWFLTLTSLQFLCYIYVWVILIFSILPYIPLPTSAHNACVTEIIYKQENKSMRKPKYSVFIWTKQVNN